VVLKPRRGCYVTELSEQDIDEVFPVMAMLEGRSPRRPRAASPAPTLPASPRSTTNSNEQAAANDADRFFEANQRFHTALQEIAGNRYLAQLIDDARKVIKLTRRDSLRLEGRLKQSLAEHREILDALRDKDPVRAQRSMHDHLMSGRNALARLAKSN
jgi:DNA-binding GntR family transcriptional regulator